MLLQNVVDRRPASFHDPGDLPQPSAEAFDLESDPSADSSASHSASEVDLCAKCWASLIMSQRKEDAVELDILAQYAAVALSASLCSF